MPLRRPGLDLRCLGPVTIVLLFLVMSKDCEWAKYGFQRSSHCAPARHSRKSAERECKGTVRAERVASRPSVQLELKNFTHSQAHSRVFLSHSFSHYSESQRNTDCTMPGTPIWKKHLTDGMKSFRKQDFDGAIKALDEVGPILQPCFLAQTHILSHRLFALQTTSHMFCMIVELRSMKSLAALTLPWMTQGRRSKLVHYIGRGISVQLGSLHPLDDPMLHWRIASQHWQCLVMALRMPLAVKSFWSCVVVWRQNPSALSWACLLSSSWSCSNYQTTHLPLLMSAITGVRLPTPSLRSGATWCCQLPRSQPFAKSLNGTSGPVGGSQISGSASH